METRAERDDRRESRLVIGAIRMLGVWGGGDKRGENLEPKILLK